MRGEVDVGEKMKRKSTGFFFFLGKRYCTGLTEPIGSVTRFIQKFGSGRTLTDRSSEKLITEACAHRRIRFGPRFHRINRAMHETRKRSRNSVDSSQIPVAVEVKTAARSTPSSPIRWTSWGNPVTDRRSRFRSAETSLQGKARREGEL